MGTLYIVAVLILIVKCDALEGGQPCDRSKICLEKYALYLMGSTITILTIIVVGLIVYIINLKRKNYSKSLIDPEKNANITYSRQDTLESDILFSTPEATRKKCLLTRQNSDLPFHDYSSTTTSNVIENRIRDLTHPNKSLSRRSPDTCFKYQHMQELKYAIIKAKKATGTTSMSDLNEILNEDLEHIETKLKEEKCSSTPILDIISAPVTPSVIKKENINIENTKASLQKLNNSQGNDTALELNKNMTSSSNNNVIESVLIHHSGSQQSLPILQKSEFSSRSSLLQNDSLEDEVYSNPPSVPKPLSSPMDHIDEIYQTGPSNRPLTYLITDIDDKDQVYDNPSEAKLLFKRIAKESTALGEDQTTDDEIEIYDDTPSKGGQNDIPEIELGGYQMPISEDSKHCLEPYYINANTVKTAEDD